MIDTDKAREALDILEDSQCIFWACPGPDHVHVQMATCTICQSIQKLREAFGSEPTRAVGISLRDQLDKALEAFAFENPLVDVWRRVPEVDDDEDEDACETMTAAFTAFCGEFGLTARVVRADGYAIPYTGYHLWTAIQTAATEWTYVDWTARQFHNLQYPPNPAHADLACPMVWSGDAAHPVLGLPGAISQGPLPDASHVTRYV